MRAKSHLVCSLLAVLGGCGGGAADPVDAAAGGIDASFCPAPRDAGASEAADGQLTGTWAMQNITLAQVQGFGGAQAATTLWLHQIVQTGSDLAVVETMCSMKIDSVDELTTVRVTPGFVSAMPPENRTGTVTDLGAGSFRYALDQNYILRGVTLTDEVNDALPTDAGDSRVGDWDNDGNAGMTLLIDGILSGQAYVIQRDFTSFSGDQLDRGRVEGLIVWGSEQVYLGSDPSTIADLASQAFPDPDANEHTFQLVRVPDGSDCAYITANACNLFHD
jgi:hypothetical protein